MARLIEPAGWVTENGNGPYGTEAEALIADLGEWAESEAVKFRAEGWAAHNRKESIKEATYIGREWAFMSMQFRIRELLDTLKEGLVNSQEGDDRCWINRGSPAANGYRIEADKAMRDYDALEVDAGIMLDALTTIAEGRPNNVFDPWAKGEARMALKAVSERTLGLRPLKGGQ